MSSSAPSLLAAILTHLECDNALLVGIVACNLKSKIVGLTARVYKKDGPAATRWRRRHALNKLVQIASKEKAGEEE